MMKPEILLLCLAALAVNFCSAQNNQTCDPNLVNAPPMGSLDFYQLEYKVWYVQEIYTRRAEFMPEPISCHSTSMGFYDDSVGLFSIYEIFNETTTGEKRSIGLLGQGIGAGPAVWGIGGIGTAHYTTVYTHTDYISYGIMHWCPFVEDAYSKYERVLTFTGDPNPDSALMGELRKKVAGIGFPTGNVVRVEHHPECNYEFEYDYRNADNNNLVDNDFDEE